MDRMRALELFKGRHFDREIIVLCIRWYLGYKLSSRDIEQMMAVRGIALTHTRIAWVHPSLAKVLSSTVLMTRHPRARHRWGGGRLNCFFSQCNTSIPAANTTIGSPNA